MPLSGTLGLQAGEDVKITRLRAAQLCQAVYAPPHTWEIDDIKANLVVEDGLRLVVVQGTKTPGNVLRDMEALSVAYPGLGGCHGGFLRAALALYPLASQAAPQGILGHSLGGSIAIILAGLLGLYGQQPKPSLLRAFEPARPSIDDALREALEGIDCELTRNGNDPVTELPIGVGAFPYRHPAPLVQVGEPKWNPIDCHYIESVIEAIEASAKS